MPSRRITRIPETQLEFERPHYADVTATVLRLCAAIRRVEEGKTVIVRVPGGETITIAPGPDLEGRVHRAFHGDERWQRLVGAKGQNFIGPDGTRYRLPLPGNSPIRFWVETGGYVIEFTRSDGTKLVYKGDLLPERDAAWLPSDLGSVPPT